MSLYEEPTAYEKGLRMALDDIHAGRRVSDTTRDGLIADGLAVSPFGEPLQLTGEGRTMRIVLGNLAREYADQCAWWVYQGPPSIAGVQCEGPENELAGPFNKADASAWSDAYNATLYAATETREVLDPRKKRQRVAHEELIREIKRAAEERGDKETVREAKLILRGNVATATQVIGFLERHAGDVT